MRNEVAFFNNTSRAYADEYGRVTPEGYSFRVRRTRVLELLPADGAGKRVLDIAGGPGVMVEDLHARGYHVDCVDAAPEMIKIAQARYGSLPQATFAVGDVYHLAYTDASVDAVTAMGLVEYLDEQDVAMAEMARVAKQGAPVIVTFPNRYSFWRTWARMLRAATGPLRTFLRRVRGTSPYPITHREYTECDARAYMERHGLTVDTIVYYNCKVTPYPFDRWFPRFTVWQSHMLENPHSPFRRVVATAFILRGIKR